MRDIVKAVIEHPEWERGGVVEQWIDEATGYTCVLSYGPLGTLNGYVAVPEGHPWCGLGFDESFCGHPGCRDHTPAARLDAAGLSFSGPIYKVLHAQETRSQWWFGFCTNHTDANTRQARAECTRLAQELAAVKSYS